MTDRSGRNWKLLIGDCRDRLADQPEGSVQTCITSPPYWGLRDYGVDGQMGLEETPEAFVREMVDVFRSVWRVLRDDGTLWVNMGDSFSDKQLAGMPWRLAFALQADGWYLRSDIIWSKPNPMPESVTDRPTKAHEYIFLMTKRPRYFYDADAIREGSSRQLKPFFRPESYLGNRSHDNSCDRVGPEDSTETTDGVGRNKRTVWEIPTQPYSEAHFATFPEALVVPCVLAGTSERGACPACGAPLVRVVDVRQEIIAAGGYGKVGDGARNPATRTDLPKDKTRRIATTTGWSPGCDCEPADPVPCVVLDPFAGSGTTGKVSVELGREFIGVELNPEYADLAAKRITNPKKWGDQSSPVIKPVEGQKTLFDPPE